MAENQNFVLADLGALLYFVFKYPGAVYSTITSDVLISGDLNTDLELLRLTEEFSKYTDEQSKFVVESTKDPYSLHYGMFFNLAVGRRDMAVMFTKKIREKKRVSSREIRRTRGVQCTICMEVVLWPNTRSSH